MYDMIMKSKYCPPNLDFYDSINACSMLSISVCDVCMVDCVCVCVCVCACVRARMRV